jgi:hypothetical protein
VTWKFDISMLDWSITQPDQLPESRAAELRRCQSGGVAFAAPVAELRFFRESLALQAATPQLIWRQPRSQQHFPIHLVALASTTNEMPLAIWDSSEHQSSLEHR